MLSLAALAGLVLAFPTAGCSKGGKHPPDATLLKTFQDERVKFEKLSVMLKADAGLRSVGYRSTDPDPAPINAKRLSAYRQMLAGLGCGPGLRRDDDNVYLLASEAGLTAMPSSKGFCYSSKAPTPLVDSLDPYNAAKKAETAYRKIEGNWYLYVWRGKL